MKTIQEFGRKNLPLSGKLYRNALQLEEFGVRKNKEFMCALWQNQDIIFSDPILKDIAATHAKKFDQLKNSVYREPDPTMTLEKFVSHLSKESNIGLELGHHRFFEIRYVASYRGNSGEDYARHHAWLICPYTQHNFKIISSLFEQSFRKPLELMPVPEANMIYYTRLQNDYGW